MRLTGITCCFLLRYYVITTVVLITSRGVIPSVANMGVTLMSSEVASATLSIKKEHQ